MTVYKAIKAEAEKAAELAVDARQGRDAAGGPTPTDRQRHEEGAVGPPDPVAVTKDNIKDTIVKDGYWTVTEICTGKYAAACKAAGIQ